MSIKRYDLCYNLKDMKETENGEYIRYTDYAKLEDEVKQLQADNAMLEMFLPDLIEELDKLREVLSEAKDAIENVPDRSIFGIGGDGMTHWYLADVLLADIEDVLEEKDGK